MAAEPVPGPPWVSALGHGHALTGRIWRPDAERFTGAGEVLETLAGARFVLLGEKHDNPDHHRLQAWILERMLARGRRPAVAFEMLNPGQEARLKAHLAADPRDAAGLGEAVGWSASGWPDWALYRPIAQAALDGAAPLLAAGLSREALREMVKPGAAAPGRALPPDLKAHLRRDIVTSHCNMLPDAMIGPMVGMMTARDANMAAVLVRGADLPGRDGAVLIAGKGHVRRDLAVPWHLRQGSSGGPVAAVGFVEVEEGLTDPAGYGARFGGVALPFDFVWFTPRLDDEDPCAKYADQLRALRPSGEEGRGDRAPDPP